MDSSRTPVFCRTELSDKFNNMPLSQAISRGRELRKEGYRLIWHGVWADSVEIPSGEEFNEARLKVRHSMVDHPEILENAFEYLVLCESTLKKTTLSQRGYELY